MLTRPGLEKLANQTWNAGPIRLLLLNSTFDPITATGSQILPAEVADIRPLVTVDTLAWNPGTNALDISISATFTPTETLLITRLALISTDAVTGDTPNEFGNLPTVAKAAGAFSLDLSTNHDITVGQLIYFSDGSAATIDTITTGATEDFTYTMTSGADPATSAAVFPARGCLLGSYEPLSTGSILAGSPITISLSGANTTT